jgi:hypothetical protein
MADFDFADPAMDAYRFTEAVSDELGEEAVEPYFGVLVGELFGLVPGLRERFSDRLMEELMEEVVRREDSRHAHATITLMQNIQTDWRNERG